MLQALPNTLKKNYKPASLANAKLFIWRRPCKTLPLSITNSICFFGWCVRLVFSVWLFPSPPQALCLPRSVKVNQSYFRHLQVSSVWATTTWDRSYHQLLTQAFKKCIGGTLLIAFLVPAQQKSCSSFQMFRICIFPLFGRNWTDRAYMLGGWHNTGRPNCPAQAMSFHS